MYKLTRKKSFTKLDVEHNRKMKPASLFSLMLLRGFYYETFQHKASVYVTIRNHLKHYNQISYYN